MNSVDFCEPLQQVTNVEDSTSIALESFVETPARGVRRVDVERHHDLRRLDKLANEARALASGRDSAALLAALDAYFVEAREIVERELTERLAGAGASNKASSVQPFAVESKLDMSLLSPAERTVFRQLVKGKPNKIIAWELSLSEATVKAHVSKILKKLKVRNRGHAIALCLNPERLAG
jgi:DNA-binding NarL/FixJ family response regulator